MSNWNATQVPDTKPGPYYVSARSQTGTAFLMRGPFQLHADALAAVGETMQKACSLDPKAHWMSWGTSRWKTEFDLPGMPHPTGRMNEFFQQQAA